MIDNWNELKEQCLNCKKCGLCETRTNVVFGVGNPNAEVMFIGEGPGENEDLQGEPFVGRGGKLLDKMLYSVDLSREENIYIANIVKCRPPKNRDPKPEEQVACTDWLRNQYKLINQKLLFVLAELHQQKLLSLTLKLLKNMVFSLRKVMF